MVALAWWIALVGAPAICCAEDSEAVQGDEARHESAPDSPADAVAPSGWSLELAAGPGFFKGDLGGWFEALADYTFVLGSTWDLVLAGGVASYAFWEERDASFYGTYREEDRTYFTDHNLGVGPLVRVSFEHRFAQSFAWRIGISGGAAYVSFGSQMCDGADGVGPLYGLWTGPMFSLGQGMHLGLTADVFRNVPNMGCSANYDDPLLLEGQPTVRPIDPGDDDGTITVLGRFRYLL